MHCIIYILNWKCLQKQFILFALVAGVCAGGLRLVEAETDQDSWFMEDDELLAAKKRMENIFGNEDFCAALLTAEDVFRPEILRAIRKLGRELKEGVPYAEDVLSLTDLEFTQGVEGGTKSPSSFRKTSPRTGPPWKPCGPGPCPGFC